MYKQHLLRSIDREIQLAKQLVPFMDDTKLDFRLGEKTRSTIEVMQYLSGIGAAMMEFYDKGMTKEDWQRIAEKRKTVTVQNFAERMEEQQNIIHAFFDNITEEDLVNKEIEIFWKEKMPLGVAIMQGPLRWLATYRMELFKLVKLSSAPDMSTKEAWAPLAESISANSTT